MPKVSRITKTGIAKAKTQSPKVQCLSDGTPSADTIWLEHRYHKPDVASFFDKETSYYKSGS